MTLVRNDKDHRIKCIFIDENMEYLNGSETINIIRRQEIFGRIHRYYIISLTAFEDEESKNRIIKSGCDIILNKPCTKSEISKIILNLKI